MYLWRRFALVHVCSVQVLSLPKLMRREVCIACLYSMLHRVCSSLKSCSSLCETDVVGSIRWRSTIKRTRCVSTKVTSVPVKQDNMQPYKKKNLKICCRTMYSVRCRNLDNEQISFQLDKNSFEMNYWRRSCCSTL